MKRLLLAIMGLLAAFHISPWLNAQQFQDLKDQPAPRLENGIRAGARLPNPDQLKGKVVLVFFWAHWCTECKAQSPVLERLVEKYRSQGLVIVGPTRRYGFVDEGRPASPDKELQYIVRVRDSFYPVLRQAPTPIGDANHKRYKVDAVPAVVLIDRGGIIRFQHVGSMTEEALDSALQPLLSQ